MASPYEITKDGFEVQFQTNHLGHFAFTYPLLRILVQTSKDLTTSVRIVQVTSNGTSFMYALSTFTLSDLCIITLGHTFAPRNITFDSAEVATSELGGPPIRYGAVS